MHLRLASLWPGLAPAWYRGELKGLLVAIGFSWVLCWLLLATFVWPIWMSGWLVAFVWLAVGSFWAYTSIRNQFSVHRLLEQVAPNSDEQFLRAQKEYLRGNWYEAEAQLLGILQRHPSDIAAGLALVGVLRKTGRARTALQRLEQLELLDAAAPWRFEIMKEAGLIHESMDEGQKTAESSDADSQDKIGVKNAV
ncbi:MAG: hypothetical protein AAF483_23930 [Planctomycetota bacterium]